MAVCVCRSDTPGTAGTVDGTSPPGTWNERRGCSTSVLSWKGGTKGSKVRSYSILFDPVLQRTKSEGKVDENYLHSDANKLLLTQTLSNTIPCENTFWSCRRDIRCPHIHTMRMMHRASSWLSSFDWVQAYGAGGVFIPQKYLLPKSQANCF